MRSQNIEYIPALDQIRGIAALWIVYYHGLHVISYQLRFNRPFGADHWIQTNNPLFAFFVEGHSAVALFMVLSGFIFTCGTYQKELSYAGFIRNRFLRTYPLFLIILFLGILDNPAAFSFPGFLQTAFGLANIKGALVLNPYTSMFWAIAVEWQFYVVFPFLLLFLNKSFKLIIGCILVAIAFRTIAFLENGLIRDLSYLSMAGRIDQFLVGMLTAVIYIKSRAHARSLRSLFPIALLMAIASMFGFHKLGGWPVEHWLKILWMTYEGILWGAFLLTYIYFADWLPKIFTTPISLAGQMSYSVYLTHYIFIVLVINRGWLLFTELPFAYSALLTTTFVVLPLVLSVSWLTYRYIEKPFINMRGVYLKN